MNTICITNRLIVGGSLNDFYAKIENIAKNKPFKIILREKDLLEQEFEKIAVKCGEICKKYNVDFAINKFFYTAQKLNVENIHLSIDDFKNNIDKLDFFKCVGVSVHSVEEALLAQKLGADYIICGHIFATDCKKGVPPRGINFLKNIFDSVNIPVFAIGGISLDNAKEIKKVGVEGVCLMSSLMNDDGEKILFDMKKI